MPEIRFAVHWNQWIIPFCIMYTEGHIIPVRWLVFLSGPFSLSISMGRKTL